MTELQYEDKDGTLMNSVLKMNQMMTRMKTGSGRRRGGVNTNIC
jgi:hypothetical protein